MPLTDDEARHAAARLIEQAEAAGHPRKIRNPAVLARVAAILAGASR